MPRIPIYEGSLSAPQGRSTAQADTGAFGFNVAPLGAAAEKYANKLEENRRIAEKFEIANKVAQGRQQWMLTLQERKDAVERGEMSGKGMTTKFMEDYSKWAADTNATMEEGVGQMELDNSLLDLQNSLLPQVQSYESAAIAKGIRQNYNSTINTLSAPILSAKSEDEVVQMSSNLDKQLAMLPQDMKVEAISTLMNTSLDKRAQLRVSSKNPNMDDLLEQAKNLNIDTAPSQFANTVERFQQYSINAKAGLETGVVKALDNSSILAMQGDLGPDAITNAQSMIDKINGYDPEQASKLQVMLNNDIETSQMANDYYTQGPSNYLAAMENLQTQYDAESDPALKNELGSRMQKTQQVFANQRKALQEDLPGVAQTKSPMVEQAYAVRQGLMNDPNVSEAQIAEANQNYINAIDNFASVMKVSNYNYLPKAEAQQVAQVLGDALRTEKGSTQAVQTIFQLRQQYGNAFPRVMQQIASTNEALKPLAVVPMLDPETGRRLVDAVNSRNMTPDLYKITEAERSTAMSNVSSLVSTMRDNGMIYQANTMLDAAMLLNKHDGKPANDSTNLRSLLSGRFETYNGNIFPIAQGISPRDIYTGSTRIVQQYDGKDIAPLIEGDTVVDFNYLKQLPLKFKNSPSDDALVLYWPGTDQPVRRKDGTAYKIPFNEAQRLTQDVKLKDLRERGGRNYAPTFGKLFMTDE